MIDNICIIKTASSVLTSVYSFPSAQAGLPGFWEGRAVVRFDNMEIQAVSYARGPERAIAMAMEKVSRMTLRAFPMLIEEVTDASK
jgi:hypothetical protein